MGQRGRRNQERKGDGLDYSTHQKVLAKPIEDL